MPHPGEALGLLPADPQLPAALPSPAYDQGVFTPTVFGQTTAGVTTYTTQTGSYTRIGNRVFFNLRVTWTAATGTGQLSIGGLPFASAALTQNAGSMYFNGVDAAQSYMLLILSTQTAVFVYGHQGGVGVAAVAVPGTGDLFMSGSYLLP